MTENTSPRCDCCGYDTHYAGVASCTAPVSVPWCHICLAMGVEPEAFWMYRRWDPKKTPKYGHFDRKEDRYFRGTEPLPILLYNKKDRTTLLFEGTHRGAVPSSF